MKTIKTKKMAAAILAMLLLAALAAGCGSKPTSVDGYQTDPTETDTSAYSTTDPWASYTEDETGETTEPGVLTSIVYIYPTDPTAATTKSTAAQTQTTKPPSTNLAHPTSTNTTTTKPTTASTKPPTTTTKPPTTTAKPTTGNYPNPITITSKDGALAAVNSAVQKVISSKVGFGKSHMITYKDWSYDPALLEGIPTVGMGNLFDPETWMNTALNGALSKGVRSATQHKGESTVLLKNPTWTMADLKDVTYSGTTNGNWTITITVKDGATRQEKRLFGSGTSGDSPIDRGPLHMATGDGGIYDHMRADYIFNMVKKLTIVNADPIDISETTTQVKFVAVLDGGGNFVSLTATYNQQINLAEIKILNGVQSYKDNVGSGSVTVTYDEFDY
jgi:hypothetical protein